MMKFILTIIFCAFTFFVHAGDSTENKAGFLAFQIANYNVYESKFVGFAAKPSEQFQRYEQMMKIAGNKELLRIAESHNNAVVRLYALRAIAEKGIFVPPFLAEKFKNDNATVRTMTGCIMSSNMVSQLSLPLLQQAADNFNEKPTR